MMMGSWCPAWPLGLLMSVPFCGTAWPEAVPLGPRLWDFARDTGGIGTAQHKCEDRNDLLWLPGKDGSHEVSSKGSVEDNSFPSLQQEIGI